jgi:hypothetical protein
MMTFGLLGLPFAGEERAGLPIKFVLSRRRAPEGLALAPGLLAAAGYGLRGVGVSVAQILRWRSWFSSRGRRCQRLSRRAGSASCRAEGAFGLTAEEGFFGQEEANGQRRKPLSVRASELRTQVLGGLRRPPAKVVVSSRRLGTG